MLKLEIEILQKGLRYYILTPINTFIFYFLLSNELIMMKLNKLFFFFFVDNLARYISGGGGGAMTLDELNVLEKHLEIWIYHVRSAKVCVLPSYKHASYPINFFFILLPLYIYN